MSDAYLNAPATRFVATHCCCCGKALVDALSVERAIGPECFKRHGADVEPSPADWTAVECFLANFGADVRADSPEVVGCRDARRIANVLVHRFARNFRTARWIPDCLYALGFHALAARCAKRARVKLGQKVEPAAVVVTVDTLTDTSKGRTTTRTVYTVRAPFSPDFNARYVPGRWFDRAAKCWRVKQDSRESLWAAIRACFKGLPIVSPDGTTKTIQ
jgi:hypothetical protein